MAERMEPRRDTVAWAFEQAPDEVYLGFSMASIFTALGLYLTGHREDAMMLGVAGTAFALTGLGLKMIGTARHLHIQR